MTDVTIAFAGVTRAGGGRTADADVVAHWPCDGGLVFAIADGVGDDESAAVASALAIDVLGRELAEVPTDMTMIRRLRRAVQAVNVELYHKRVTVPELAQMGTTLTVTAVWAGTLVAAHVGDCRLWLFRDRSLVQLTKDHTWGGDDLPSGLVARGSIRSDPRRYARPRCLGHELIVSIDLLSMDLHPGDALVHTSDGVHGSLPEGDIRELLEAHPPEAACQALVRRAQESNDTEDASAQIAKIGDETGAPPKKSWWRR